MSRHVLLLWLALLPGCGDRTPPPELVPFIAPGFAHCAQAGDVVLGGQPSPDGLRRLADRGFATIVSTRTATELDWDEREVVESLGMRFVRIPMPIPLTPVTPEQVAALDGVLRADGGPIYLHCAGGTRVAVLWATWVSGRHGVDPTITLEQAAQAGVQLVQPAVTQLLGRTGP